MKTKTATTIATPPREPITAAELADIQAESLVATFREQGYAMMKVGDAEVRIDVPFGRNGEGAQVKVNWPSIGAQSPARTMSWASDLVHAGRIALAAERRLAAAA